MSFSDKKAVYYLVNQFHYCLLVRYIKTLAVLKHQRFEDSESNKMELSISKRQQFDMPDNKEGQGLDNYKSKDESKRYILLPFIAPP